MAKKAGYGRVISVRIATPRAKQLANIAKAKSTDTRKFRVSDLLRIATEEFVARHSQEAA